MLTRYGPQKTTVVDVARALGVSHGSVYRHFASKAALRDAVTERWLDRVSAPLAKIVAEDSPAPRAAAQLVRPADRHQAAEGQAPNPNCSPPTMRSSRESRDVVRAHVDHLAGQVSAIVADGIRRGEFADVDPAATGRAIFYATARFHDPSYAAEWGDPGLDAAFEDLWTLLARGLGPPPSGGATKPVRGKARRAASA